MGYMTASGYEDASGYADNPRAATDGTGFEQWMDTYCRANPQKAIVIGAAELVRELRAPR
jgi:hypothetical protein